MVWCERVGWSVLMGDRKVRAFLPGTRYSLLPQVGWVGQGSRTEGTLRVSSWSWSLTSQGEDFLLVSVLYGSIQRGSICSVLLSMVSGFWVLNCSDRGRDLLSCTVVSLSDEHHLAYNSRLDCDPPTSPTLRCPSCNFIWLPTHIGESVVAESAVT